MRFLATSAHCWSAVATWVEITRADNQRGSSCGRDGAFVAENGGGGHDVYHNKRTYPQSGRFGGIVMLLMINDLKVFSRSDAEIQGN